MTEQTAQETTTAEAAPEAQGDASTYTGTPVPAPTPERNLHPWEQRVIEEKNALDTKLAALVEFIHGVQYRTLPQVSKEKLVRQQLYMVCYSNVLLERVTDFIHAGALAQLTYPATWVVKD